MMVADIMLQQLDLDILQEAEKESLWESGLSIESAFSFLDRYSKGFVADTDVWQIMHAEASPGAVPFSGVCAMFREVKGKDQKKSGQLNLNELVNLFYPRNCEELKLLDSKANDDEVKNILYLVRNTVPCPGCDIRCQRTYEGCPSITCPICRTSFRCNEFGDKKDGKLNLNGKHSCRKFLKFAIENAQDHESLRKELACSGGMESLSSILLDAFLLFSDDKGYLTFHDFKAALLRQKALRQIELDLLWFRYARGEDKIGFVEFAQQLRPFGSA